MSARVCASCGAEALDSSSVSCSSCAAPLRLLEPMVVDCGWCDAPNHREQTAHCLKCGGPLPALPGGNPGPRPPAVPRSLPRGYAFKVKWTGNVLVMIGAGFTIVFFWSVLFPLIGMPLWYFGWRKAKRWLHALEHGQATRGRLSSVARDRSQSSNGKHPWRIEYVFDRADGSQGEGFCEAWDPGHAQRQAGDAVWVVYDELEEGAVASAVWPPLH